MRAYAFRQRRQSTDQLSDVFKRHLTTYLDNHGNTIHITPNTTKNPKGRAT